MYNNVMALNVYKSSNKLQPATVGKNYAMGSPSTLDKNKPSIIVDIDGTIANIDHRIHTMNEMDKPWEILDNRDLIMKDPVNNTVKSFIDNHKDAYNIILLTGRHYKHKDLTLEWLNKHTIPFDALFMRKHYDIRESYLYKKGVYNEVLKKYNVSLALDDEKDNIDMWNSQGIKTYKI